MKDYYDLFYLANKFDFDGAILTEVLKKTFENRGHHFTVEQFDQVMAFGGDDAMQKKWKAFCRKIKESCRFLFYEVSTGNELQTFCELNSGKIPAAQLSSMAC